jgi:hypothetical protein
MQILWTLYTKIQTQLGKVQLPKKYKKFKKGARAAVYIYSVLSNGCLDDVLRDFKIQLMLDLNMQYASTYFSACRLHDYATR